MKLLKINEFSINVDTVMYIEKILHIIMLLLFTLRINDL